MNVLKTGTILIVLFISLTFTNIYAQDQNELVEDHQEIIDPDLHFHSPAMPVFNIVNPTLNKFCKGLPYYEFILGRTDNNGLLIQKREEKTILLKYSLSEMDMEIMNENLLFINKQSRIQLMEWVKKDKWDLNLGEAIKGFYMQPVF